MLDTNMDGEIPVAPPYTNHKEKGVAGSFFHQPEVEEDDEPVFAP